LNAVYLSLMSAQRGFTGGKLDAFVKTQALSKLPFVQLAEEEELVSNILHSNPWESGHWG